MCSSQVKKSIRLTRVRGNAGLLARKRCNWEQYIYATRGMMLTRIDHEFAIVLEARSTPRAGIALIGVHDHGV